MTNSTHKSGFTLLETVVVLLVAGILMGMALPNLHKFNQNRTIEAAAQMLQSDLNYLRTLAVGQHHLTQIVFDPANTSYTTYADLDDNGTFESTELLKTVKLDNTFTDVRFGRASSINTNPLYGSTTHSDMPSISFGGPEVGNLQTRYHYGGVASQAGYIFLTTQNDLDSDSTDNQLSVTVQRIGSVKWWRYNGGRWINL